MDFYSQNRQDLTSAFGQLGVSTANVRTIMAAAYKKFSLCPWVDATPPKLLRSWLDGNAAVLKLDRAKILVSSYDRSVKFLFKLADGFEVESVLMPEKSRITICLSSQVGCAQGCVFCFTGKMGLKRNLLASEILLQVIEANRWIEENPTWLKDLNLPTYQRISNVVFMGMGEPLDNLNEVTKSISIMTDPWGLNLAARKITISTAGHLEGLKSALEAMPEVSYALSVHATSESERSKLMPINRRFPLGEILSFLREKSKTYKKDFLIQYTVISQVNDSLDNAERLATLLEGVNVKVNLIPLNPIEPSRLNSPDPKRLEVFRDYLYERGIRVMIRYSKGQDIMAACGQLVTKPTSSPRASSNL